MRRVAVSVLAVLLLAAVSYAQPGNWTFEKLLVDFRLPQSNAYGVHAVVVDPDDHIWVGLHAITTDTIFTAAGDTIPLNPIFVFDKDGNQVSFSPIKFLTVNGQTDTLSTALKCKGMHLDHEGNILYSAGGQALYRINYKTGEAMAKWESPIKSSLTEAGVDAQGNIYIGYVLGKDKPVYILDKDFNMIGTAIDTLGYINRTIEVTPDGKDLYTGSTWNGFGIVHWHSDIPGVLKYAPVDTFGNWYNVTVGDTTYEIVYLWASCLDWGPRGYLWAGNLRPDWSGPKGGMYYAYDVVTKQCVDSVGISMGDSSKGGIYSPRGAAWSNDGNTMYLGDYDYNVVSVWKYTPTGVVDQARPKLPARFELGQNYPNPFNPTTVIPFSLTKDSHVQLKIYDSMGREVGTLLDRKLAAGHHKILFNGAGLPSGTYYVSLEVEGSVQTRKMVLIK